MTKKEYNITRLNKATILSFVLIIISLIGFVLIFLQLSLVNEVPSTFGVFGDAVGGVLNPIIGIGASVLTFLAFYMQKIANDILKKQFKKTKKDEHNDFIFANYKSRLTLIISEVNSFNASFHNNKLISGVELLGDKTAKKYNFTGLQAISLFLLEYFRHKEELEENGIKEFRESDSYHSLYQNIGNIISAFYNAHIAIQNCNLPNEYKLELRDLSEYIYFSKFNFFIYYLKGKSLQEKLKLQVDELFIHYDLGAKKI